MTVRLRALERDDLEFVHRLSNDVKIMSYWFDEPFEALVELRDIYDRHIHDTQERRFIIERAPGTDDEDPAAAQTPPPGDRDPVGVVELVQIHHLHRSSEIQIIVAPGQQGRGYATAAMTRGLDYAFRVLNLHKVYLVVDVENHGAVHIYDKIGFVTEGTLREEFFADGRYHDAYRMSILQREHLARS